MPNAAQQLLTLKIELGRLIGGYSAIASHQHVVTPLTAEDKSKLVYSASVDESAFVEPEFIDWIQLLADEGNHQQIPALQQIYKDRHPSVTDISTIFGASIACSPNLCEHADVITDFGWNLRSHQLMTLAKIYQYLDKLDINELNKAGKEQELGSYLNDVCQIALTTGAGKTIIQGLLMTALARADIPATLYFPDETLSVQAFGDWRNLNIKTEGEPLSNPTVFSRYGDKSLDVQTHKELIEVKADLKSVVIVDEAHLLTEIKESVFKKFVERIKKSWCILVTASPSLNLLKAIEKSGKKSVDTGQLTNADKVKLGYATPLQVQNYKAGSLFDEIKAIGGTASRETIFDTMLRPFVKYPNVSLVNALLTPDLSDIVKEDDYTLRDVFRRNLVAPIHGKALVHVSNYEDIVNTLYRYDIDPKGQKGWSDLGRYYQKSAHRGPMDVNDYRKYLQLRKKHVESLWSARITSVAIDFKISKKSKLTADEKREVKHNKDLTTYWSKQDLEQVELNTHIHGQVDFYLALFIAASEGKLDQFTSAVDVVKKFGAAAHLSQARKNQKGINTLREKLKESFGRDPLLVEKVISFLDKETSLPSIIKGKSILDGDSTPSPGWQIRNNIKPFYDLLSAEVSLIEGSRSYLIENYELEDFRENPDAEHSLHWGETTFFTSLKALSSEIRNLGFFNQIQKNERILKDHTFQDSIPLGKVFSGLELKKTFVEDVKKPVQPGSTMETAINMIGTASDYSGEAITFTPQRVYEEDEINFQQLKNLHVTGLAYHLVSDAFFAAHDDPNLHRNIAIASSYSDSTSDVSNQAQILGRDRGADPYKTGILAVILKDGLTSIDYKSLNGPEQYKHYIEGQQVKLKYNKEEIIASYVESIKRICQKYSLENEFGKELTPAQQLEEQQEFLALNTSVINKLMQLTSFDKKNALQEFKSITKEAEYRLLIKKVKIDRAHSSFSSFEQLKNFGLYIITSLSLLITGVKSYLRRSFNFNHPTLNEEDRFHLAEKVVKLPLDHLANFVDIFASMGMRLIKSPPTVTIHEQSQPLTFDLISKNIIQCLQSPSLLDHLLANSYASLSSALNTLNVKSTYSFDDFCLDANEQLSRLDVALIENFTDREKHEISELLAHQDITNLELIRVKIIKKLTHEQDPEHTLNMERIINEHWVKLVSTAVSEKSVYNFKTHGKNLLDDFITLRDDLGLADSLEYLEENTQLAHAFKAWDLFSNSDHELTVELTNERSRCQAVFFEKLANHSHFKSLSPDVIESLFSNKELTSKELYEHLVLAGFNLNDNLIETLQSIAMNVIQNIHESSYDMIRPKIILLLEHLAESTEQAGCVLRSANYLRQLQSTPQSFSLAPDVLSFDEPLLLASKALKIAKSLVSPNSLSSPLVDDMVSGLSDLKSISVKVQQTVQSSDPAFSSLASFIAELSHYSQTLLEKTKPKIQPPYAPLSLKEFQILLIRSAVRSPNELKKLLASFDELKVTFSNPQSDEDVNPEFVAMREQIQRLDTFVQSYKNYFYILPYLPDYAADLIYDAFIEKQSINTIVKNLMRCCYVPVDTTYRLASSVRNMSSIAFSYIPFLSSWTNPQKNPDMSADLNLAPVAAPDAPESVTASGFNTQELMKICLGYVTKRGEILLKEPKDKYDPLGDLSLSKSLISNGLMNNIEDNLLFLKQCADCYPEFTKLLQSKTTDESKVVLELERIMFDIIVENLKQEPFKVYWKQIKQNYTDEEINHMARSDSFTATLEQLMSHNKEEFGLNQSQMLVTLATGLAGLEGTVLSDLNHMLNHVNERSIPGKFIYSLGKFALPIGKDAEKLLPHYEGVHSLPSGSVMNYFKQIFVPDQKLSLAIQMNIVSKLLPNIDGYLQSEQQKQLPAIDKGLMLLSALHSQKDLTGIVGSYKKVLIESNQGKEIDDLVDALETLYQEVPLESQTRDQFIPTPIEAKPKRGLEAFFYDFYLICLVFIYDVKEFFSEFYQFVIQTMNSIDSLNKNEPLKTEEGNDEELSADLDEKLSISSIDQTLSKPTQEDEVSVLSHVRNHIVFTKTQVVPTIKSPTARKDRGG